MNFNDLKVGDMVFIREDLEDDKLYGNNVYIDDMCKGIQEIGLVSREHGVIRTVETPDYSYTPEMIDWNKTEKLRRENMNIKDLKAGDVVYIRDDVNKPEKEWAKWVNRYDDPRLTGVQQIFKVYYNNDYFEILGELDKPWANRNSYTVEMIDWNKTMKRKLVEEFIDGDVSVTSRNHIEEVKEEINKEFGYHDKVTNPSHYGGGGIHDIECYKAIEHILDKLENVPEKYFGHVSNIVKYVWRCNNKNGYEDLDKVSVYFDFMFREDD